MDATTPCPYCGKEFKVVRQHITKTHETLRVEVRKVRDDSGEWDFSARVLRNGVVVGDWDSVNSTETVSDSASGRVERHNHEFVWRDERRRCDDAKKKCETGAYLILIVEDYTDGETPTVATLYRGGNKWEDPFVGMRKAFGATCVFVE